MKKAFTLALILLSLALPDNLGGSSARCVGADPCRACSNCNYCQRCAKQGLTCGVCKPKRKPGE